MKQSKNIKLLKWMQTNIHYSEMKWHKQKIIKVGTRWKCSVVNWVSVYLLEKDLGIIAWKSLKPSAPYAAAIKKANRMLVCGTASSKCKRRWHYCYKINTNEKDKTYHRSNISILGWRRNRRRTAGRGILTCLEKFAFVKMSFSSKAANMFYHVF